MSYVLSELNKVHQYLITNKISCERYDIFDNTMEFHQIKVYDNNTLASVTTQAYVKADWDVIVDERNGRLQLYGSIVSKVDNKHDVISSLTAEDVIKLVEKEGK